MSDIEEQLAIGRIKAFATSFGQRTFHLACHAAIPVVFDPELLHLLRINFFLDPPEFLPFSSECDILFSPLCHEIGADLYEMAPAIRDVLLKELATMPQYGEQRIREIASLLLQYVQRSSRWKENVALERGQQLTALNFLDAPSAKLWLEAVQQRVHQDSSNERKWFIAMREELLKIDEVLKARPINSDEVNAINPTGLEFLSSISAHGEPIGTIAWSPDGAKLASASVDGTIKVWDVGTAHLIQTLRGHTRRVICAAWSATDNCLATGSDDGTAKIWEMESGRLVETIEGSTSPVSLAWSWNGRILAFGFDDGTIQLWDKTQRVVRTYEGPTGRVTSLRWSPNAVSLAASSERDTRVIIWSYKKEQDRVQSLTHESYVLDIDWSPDGSMIAAGCSDHSVWLWAASTRKLIKILKGHRDIVNAVSFSSDSLLIASKSHDGTVRIWRSDNGESVSIIEKQGMALTVAGLAFSPAKPQLATLSHSETTINIWQVNTSLLYGRTEGWLTSTKIVLLGERGVGKTSLARALSTMDFQADLLEESQREKTLPTSPIIRGVSESRSTRMYTAASLTVQDPLNGRCEIFLWDVGLPDPLLTKIYLFDANTVLVLFDGWESLMRLEQYWKMISGKKRTTRTIWIGIDKENGEGITDRRLQLHLARRRKSYMSVDLRTGKGFREIVALLRQKLRSDLNERTVARKSASSVDDSTLQALRKAIFSLKQQRDPPVYFRRVSEMRDLLDHTYTSTNPRRWRQGLRFLQHEGLVQLMRGPQNQDIVWLEPMYVNQLLESLVSAARGNLQHPGAVPEDRLVNLAYADPVLKELDRDVIEVLIGSTTQLLLQRKICSRSVVDKRKVLLFPSIVVKSETMTNPSIAGESEAFKLRKSVRKSESPTESEFNKLLEWLSPDREKAGIKYEQIRHQLIRIFENRGVNTAEELADATIEKVTKRVEEIANDYTGDPARYFHAVAKNVFLEYARRGVSPNLSRVPDDPGDSDALELQHYCLDKCLANLPRHDRELILQYYSGERQSKIDSRKQLSERFQISLETLRVRVFRLRASLQECVVHCMAKEQGPS